MRLRLQPFRFPATFTFVVRSFTVLDGIGKGLNPRFDISEIAAPYARGCAYTLTQEPQGPPLPGIPYSALCTVISAGLSEFEAVSVVCWVWGYL